MTQSEHVHATGHARAQPLPRLDATAIADARQHHSLVELLERHGIAVAGSGSRRTAHCPFHDDQSPSLSVYLDSNRYYCFACGASGDAIALVQRLDGLDFRAAVARLTQSTERSPSLDADVTPGDAMPSTDATDSTDAQDMLFHGPSEVASPPDPVRPALQAADLLTVAAALYQAALIMSQEALTYLRARGIKEETARHMHVGYGRPGALRDFLGDDPALVAQAQAVGLLDAFSKERLAERIIFPEIREGRCLWMVGRTLVSDVATRAPTDQEQQQVADHLADHHVARTTTLKYLGVTASKPLMGIGALRCDGPSANRRPTRASRSARSARSQTDSGIGGVIVVEGPFDLLAAKQWRLPLPCVALVGAHASHQQLTELMAFAAGRPIWLALDADTAGDAGVERLRTVLTAARYPGPLYRLNPPFGAKDFGEVAGTPVARRTVLRALTHPEECAFILSGASQTASRNRAVEASS